MQYQIHQFLLMLESYFQNKSKDDCLFTLTIIFPLNKILFFLFLQTLIFRCYSISAARIINTKLLIVYRKTLFYLQVKNNIMWATIEQQ